MAREHLASPVKLLRKLLLSVLLVLATGAAFAQAPSTGPAFPQRPIRMIIGFPAGGPIDVVGRLIGPRFFEGSGYSVIVDNRAGANGIIATDLVAKSAPDGYTLLFGTTGNLSVNPSLYRNLPFDIHRDFTPLSHVSSVASLLYVHPSIASKTLGEFIAYAAANPGKVNFSSSGSGGLPHLSGELLNALAKVRTVHVPYKGTVPAFNALLSGEVQFFFSAVVTGLQHVKAGKLKALATTVARRSGRQRNAARLRSGQLARHGAPGGNAAQRRHAAPC
jgi:tripartite-type tricarboxylate transporter receptor subunit TctC